jgi:large subunit ribosomal protein L33
VFVLRAKKFGLSEIYSPFAFISDIRTKKDTIGGKMMRVKITLACTETGDRNYITTKNKRTNPDRIELMKYSPRLKKRTLHRETK